MVTPQELQVFKKSLQELRKNPEVGVVSSPTQARNCQLQMQPEL